MKPELRPGDHRLVAIVEDHDLLGEALAAALQAEGCAVTRPPLDGSVDVIAALVEAKPDVALLDLDLGAAGSGLDIIAALVAAGIGVLIVSATTDETTIGACLEQGASGWVPKSTGFDALLAVILALTEGRSVLAEPERQRLMRAMGEDRRRRRAALAPFEALSAREAAVLRELIAGRSVERIAETSFVSVATVRTQVRAVLLKLGVNSQLEAVAVANRVGWPSSGGQLDS